MYKTITFSREEMFEKVWSTPLLQLAKDIGVSDVAVAKACRKTQIPLPGRGYWAKNERERPRKPKLPGLSKNDARLETVRFNVLDVDKLPILKRPKMIIGETIVVANTLEKPHTLVAATKKLAEKAHEYYGRICPRDSGMLDIRVSRTTFDRALRVLDALIKASEAIGYSWKVTDKGKTVVIVDGETMEIHLHEKTQRREIARTPTPPLRRGERWEPNWAALSSPREEFAPSGRLGFHIDQYFPQPIQRNWQDSSQQRIDDRLNEILAGLVPAAHAVKAWRLKFEAELQRRKLEEERRKAAARSKEEVRRLRMKLADAVEQWEHATRIRTFCQYVEQTLDRLSPENRLAGKKWLEWANEQAAILDSVHNDPNRLFILSVPVEESFGTSRSQSNDGWWTAAEERRVQETRRSQGDILSLPEQSDHI